MEASREELARLFLSVLPHLKDRQRRVVAGAVARELGRGGESVVPEASGKSCNTVIKAEREEIEPSDRQRALGSGDIKAKDKQPGRPEALEALAGVEARGSPMSVLAALGVQVDRRPCRRARAAGLQDYQRHGPADPRVPRLQPPGKELVGEFSNKGREYQKEGEPARVNVNDFADKELGRAVPSGQSSPARRQIRPSMGANAKTGTTRAIGASSRTRDRSLA